MTALTGRPWAHRKEVREGRRGTHDSDHSEFPGELLIVKNIQHANQLQKQRGDSNMAAVTEPLMTSPCPGKDGTSFTASKGSQEA